MSYMYKTYLGYKKDCFLALSFANFSTISFQSMLRTTSSSMLKIDNADVFFHLPKMNVNNF